MLTVFDFELIHAIYMRAATPMWQLLVQRWVAMSAGEAGGIGVQRVVAMPLLDADIAELTHAPDPRLTNYPLSSSVVDEVMCIARFIESQNQQVA